jgi:hypothetical protein
MQKDILTSIQPMAGSFSDLFRRISAEWLAPLYGASAKAAPPAWTLLVGPRSLNPTLLTVIARLAQGDLSPAVCVLDAGNRFNAYTVARAARGRPDVLNRITVSRAFTCYQVLSLLENSSSAPFGHQATAPQERIATGGMLPSRPVRPAGPLTFVVLDLLNTFYDESVQVGERKRLLRDCIRHLERLVAPAGGSSTTPGTDTAAAQGPPANGNRELPRLVVSVHPPRVASQAAVALLELLQASAVDTCFIQTEAPAAEPLRLF